MSDFIELNYDDDLVKFRPDRIESIRPWNDGLTYIWMFSGDHFTVKESPQEILAKIEEWKKLNDPETIKRDIEKAKLRTTQAISMTGSPGHHNMENKISYYRCGNKYCNNAIPENESRCGRCGNFNFPGFSSFSFCGGLPQK